MRKVYHQFAAPPRHAVLRTLMKIEKYLQELLKLWELLELWSMGIGTKGIMEIMVS